MATYTLDLTPQEVNLNTEGSLDVSIVNGNSIQRTGFFDVWNSNDRKVVEVSDGATFNDDIETWDGMDFIITVSED